MCDTFLFLSNYPNTDGDYSDDIFLVYSPVRNRVSNPVFSSLLTESSTTIKLQRLSHIAAQPHSVSVVSNNSFILSAFSSTSAILPPASVAAPAQPPSLASAISSFASPTPFYPFPCLGIHYGVLVNCCHTAANHN